MGDFNDEPFDPSLLTHALSTRQRLKVTQADLPLLWNLMWPALGIPEGTFYFNNQPNVLDQFLVNKNMTTAGSPITAHADSVEIMRFPGTFTGDYHRPKPFGGMGKPIDDTGYSDHFPIGIQITETD